MTYCFCDTSLCNSSQYIFITKNTRVVFYPAKQRVYILGIKLWVCCSLTTTSMFSKFSFCMIAKIRSSLAFTLFFMLCRVRWQQAATVYIVGLYRYGSGRFIHIDKKNICAHTMKNDVLQEIFFYAYK